MIDPSPPHDPPSQPADTPSDTNGPRPARRPWSLSARVSMVLGVAVTVPILGVAGYLTSTKQAERQASVEAHIRSMTTGMCIAADVYIDKHRAAITALGASMSGVPLRAGSALHDRLANARRVYPGFLTMLVANQDGFLVSAAPLRNPEGRDVLSLRTRVNDRPYFVVPMRDRSTFVSEVFLGRGFGNDPIVAISAPIQDVEGRAIGVVEGSLDLSAFEKLVAPARLTPGIDYLIVDGRDRVIHSGGTSRLPPLTPIGDSPLLRAARIERGNAPFTYESDAASSEASDRRLAGQCSTDVGWTILVSQSLAPIRAERIRQYTVTLIWTLVALVVAVLISVAIARSVTRPIDTLSAAVSAFHPHGALPTIVRTGSEPAELALLLDRFNAMAHRANESDRSMNQALSESRETQAELARVLHTREFEVNQRTAELAARSEELAAVNARLERLANVDPLTGIANRRALMSALDLASRGALRECVPVSILAVDVDHFKAYNDALGHPAGDQCLKQVARALESFARRPLDVAGRIGGEEFVVVLYAVAGGTALRLGEKLRSAVEALRIPHPGSPMGWVTVSIGVATIAPDSETETADAMDLADAALYEAKRGGRNRVMSAAAPGESALAAPRVD